MRLKIAWEKMSICFCILFLVSKNINANVWYVSTMGSSSGNGTINNTWSLDYALNLASSTVKPGDTVFIRGGRYNGKYICNLQGNAAQPIWVMAYPTERVLLDSYLGIDNDIFTTLRINGFYIYFKNIEFTDSSPSRISNGTAYPPADLHSGTGVDFFGEGSKLINCILHDIPGGAVGFWKDANLAEIYGCIFYYNGLSDNTRGRGPNVYMQNSNIARPKSVRNCFIFTGYDIGIQHYSSADYLKGCIIDSNTIFNSGEMTRTSEARRANFLAGGETAPYGTRVRGLKVTDNIFYRDTTDNTNPSLNSFLDYKKNVELGYTDDVVTDSDIVFNHNHLYGDPTPIKLFKWDTGQVRYNTIYSYKSNSPNNRFILEQPVGSAPLKDWDYNTYFTNQPSFTTVFGSRNFTQWQTDYGVDANSTWTNGPPTQNYYYVRKNRYDTGRYFITVMNYLDQNMVQLPFGNSNLIGTKYLVYDVQQSVFQPIDSGTYNGNSIALNLANTQVATPVGTVPVPPRHTAKTLGSFILEFNFDFVTIAAGNWNNPAIWNRGKTPDEYALVTLNHNITIPTNAWCKRLLANGHTVTINSGVLLNVGRQ